MSYSVQIKTRNSVKQKKVNNVIHLTTSETLRLGEPDILINNTSRQILRAITPPLLKKSSCSFQITGVSLTQRDFGDDSADDLDESHTDDNSRVTDNETPSFSEDTCSRDTEDNYIESCSALCSVTVLPTTSDFELGSIALSDTCFDSSTISYDNTEQLEILGEDEFVMSNLPSTTTPGRPCPGTRFTIVKVETSTPFKRGRWECVDYFDNSIYTPKHALTYKSPTVDNPSPHYTMTPTTSRIAVSLGTNSTNTTVVNLVSTLPAQPRNVSRNFGLGDYLVLTTSSATSICASQMASNVICADPYVQPQTAADPSKIFSTYVTLPQIRDQINNNLYLNTVTTRIPHVQVSGFYTSLPQTQTQTSIVGNSKYRVTASVDSTWAQGQVYSAQPQYGVQASEVGVCSPQVESTLYNPNLYNLATSQSYTLPSASTISQFQLPASVAYTTAQDNAQSSAAVAQPQVDGYVSTAPQFQPTASTQTPPQSSAYRSASQVQTLPSVINVAQYNLATSPLQIQTRVSNILNQTPASVCSTVADGACYYGESQIKGESLLETFVQKIATSQTAVQVPLRSNTGTISKHLNYSGSISTPPQNVPPAVQTGPFSSRRHDELFRSQSEDPSYTPPPKYSINSTPTTPMMSPLPPYALAPQCGLVYPAVVPLFQPLPYFPIYVPQPSVLPEQASFENLHATPQQYQPYMEDFAQTRGTTNCDLQNQIPIVSPQIQSSKFSQGPLTVDKSTETVVENFSSTQINEEEVQQILEQSVTSEDIVENLSQLPLPQEVFHVLTRLLTTMKTLHTTTQAYQKKFGIPETTTIYTQDYLDTRSEYCELGEATTQAASNTSALIDTKIEQAMDLVKIHLLYTVREEVKVLKLHISELLRRINQLEQENSFLKANATTEMLVALNSRSEVTTFNASGAINMSVTTPVTTTVTTTTASTTVP